MDEVNEFKSRFDDRIFFWLLNELRMSQIPNYLIVYPATQLPSYKWKPPSVMQQFRRQQWWCDASANPNIWITENETQLRRKNVLLKYIEIHKGKSYKNCFVCIPYHTETTCSCLLHNRHVEWPFRKKQKNARIFHYCCAITLKWFIFERSTFNFKQACERETATRVARNWRANKREDCGEKYWISFSWWSKSIQCVEFIFARVRGSFSYKLQVIEKIGENDRRSAWWMKASRFSVSSMLRATTSLLQIFREGCTWKLFSCLLFSIIAVGKWLFV